jgi:hypothetical protein
VRVGPPIETTAWVAYDLGCQKIRPIVNNWMNLPQLRFQNMNRDLRITFCGSNNGIRVGHAPGSQAIRSPGQREIQDRRPMWVEAIQMRIKGIVKQYIAGMDPKSAPVACFLIPSGEDNGSIGTRMCMPGLQQPAVASFAACGDSSKERHLGSVAQ